MIQDIFIAAEPQAKQQNVDQIEVIAQKGIVGDRNFDQHRWHGQNITLVESENIEAFNQQYGKTIDYQDTRRNIITRGIKLNQLIGKSFYIGTVKLIGTELCEPCHMLCQSLSDDTLSQQQVQRAFTEKAGIRATVLNSGFITLNMSIDLDNVA
ncbi:MAG: MOSC domain-containing protein YiiM [Methylophagaceae bacterium]|jgi:MOSC domain-containing protein YiiM